MRRNLPRLFLVLSLCLLAGVGLVVSYSATRSLSSMEIPELKPVDNSIKEIAGYRDWSKVNSEPQLMPDPTALLCAQVIRGGTKNPHNNKYLTVYVNEIPIRITWRAHEQILPRAPEDFP